MRTRVTAKLQRHHIRNILQNASVESWTEKSTQSRNLEESSLLPTSSGTSGANCFTSRETRLLDEYLREVGEAKLMLVRV